LGTAPIGVFWLLVLLLLLCRLWPVAANGFDDLVKRTQAQAEGLAANRWAVKHSSRIQDSCCTSRWFFKVQGLRVQAIRQLCNRCACVQATMTTSALSHALYHLLC
jgi:hypothetical protein